MARVVLLGLAALACALAATAQSARGYAEAMAMADAAKQAGDMPGMERNIQEALKAGRGDEYAWRSLAWAQMNQGKWRESLANARENVRRNGKTSWSLEQLYASAMAAGDTRLAGSALDQEAELPAAARNRSLEGERKQYAAATRPTRYELAWKLNVADYQKQKGELVINVPFRKHLWQVADLGVEGATSVRFEEIDHRDVAFINPGDATTVTLRAVMTHRPEVRGAGFAARTRSSTPPPNEKLLLGPFRNRIDYDPASPLLADILPLLKRPTPGETVQAVLDWLAANVRYVDGYPDDLASILANRKGVCHHQSNLMVTLCRALGIPALVAHGVRLGGGDGEIKDVMASHGWVEVFLDGKWVGVEPLNPNSLRYFDSGYLIVDATGRGTGNDHFLMYTRDRRHIEGIQGVPVSGSSRLVQ